MTLTAMYGLLYDATLTHTKRLNTGHPVFF